MKILFITNDFIVEPLGIMYLSSALKKAGHQTDLIKADLENIEEKVRTFSPDIIGYNVTTGQHKYFTELNLKLKNKFHFISLFGGAHPTFFNEFIKEEGVDIICIGEGEEAIVDLADKIDQGKDFKNIPNLWVKEKGEVIKNPVRSLVDVNSIAFPDRELIYSRYPKSYNNPIKNFIGGRGCPYNCSFCFNHCLKKVYQNNGQYVRFSSVDNLLKEILEVKNNYPLKMVYFQDDTFATQIDWLEEFSEKYPKIVNLPFHCHIRANLVNEKFINLLKKAGCYGVSFAIEVADDYLRNQVLKKNISREEIIRAAKLIKKAGIKFRIYNILGLPGSSLNTELETLKLNILCKPDLGWASIYQPYPKTELGDLCIKMGIYDGDVDKISESFFEETVLDIPDKDKINNLQKLFSLMVSFPFLRPLIRILISFPPNILYKKIYYFWKERLYKKIYNL